ncbi:hypothetical protein BH24ACT7_BH24ACT7_01790 [soil metagenome]
MAAPEARRHDLYNRLEEVLGTDGADTLMAYLPATEAAALATTKDIGGVQAEIQGVRTAIQAVRAEVQAFNNELRAEIQAVRAEVQAFNNELRAEIQAFKAEIRTELTAETQAVRGDIRAVNGRLDRLFLTLAAGLIAVVGALVSSLFLG